MVMGLLMGTGPASYLCSQVKFNFLVLMVPLKSWRRLAKHKASFMGNIVPKDYFNNFENLQKGVFNYKILIIDEGPDEDGCDCCVIIMKRFTKVQKCKNIFQKIQFHIVIL
ncbi:hypothetical protein ABPG72_014392 [Tetrahymena utriculariae]